MTGHVIDRIYGRECRRRRCPWCQDLGKPSLCRLARSPRGWRLERLEYRYRRYRRYLMRQEMKNLIWRRD